MGKKIFKFLSYSIISIFMTLFLLFSFMYFSSMDPPGVENIQVNCNIDNPPKWDGKSPLKVLSWNVQYLAGKDYVFFYDLPNDSGPDERPSREAIEKTTLSLIKVINDANPDIILFQEVDDNAKRTDYEDQLAKIVNLLPKDYTCHSSALYWQNGFNPHPKVLGRTGMKLSTISKYKIDSSVRYQLPKIPGNFFISKLYLKRAILETNLPIQGKDKPISILNTHLDAFAQGYDTMEKQVDYVKNLLSEKENSKTPWLIGGDFNLLPPGFAPENLHKDERIYYQKDSEIKILFNEFQSVITKEELTGKNNSKYFTINPNHPEVTEPDRTIDYIFYGKTLNKNSVYVIRKGTEKISDHLPIYAEFNLKE